MHARRFLCGFSHIFAGGYAAGYFSYKWAEVLSADAFSAFEEVGLDNKPAVAERGRAFRDTVLALGGGRPPADVFRVRPVTCLGSGLVAMFSFCLGHFHGLSELLWQSTLRSG